MAAGLLLCKEVGLSFCNLNGNTYNFKPGRNSVVIANQQLIDQYKKIVKN
jgi:fructose-1,6-bisphosphatase/inositol monophosphatase family enzyme